jgi:ABC-type lipoprotein export system ATPase subunit
VSRGSNLWRDQSIENADPSDLVQRGLVQVLEGTHCFPQLTVEENILTGGFARGLSRAEINNGLDRVYRWFPRLKERRKTRSGYTSGGEQQTTAIGRALMTVKPSSCWTNLPGGSPQSHDGFKLNRHRTLELCWSMIFSKNRKPLFRIML